MPVQTRDEAIAALMQVLEPRTDLDLAVLHGSAASGTLSNDSDIDLAIALALTSLEFIQDIQPIVREAQARRIKEFANGR